MLMSKNVNNDVSKDSPIGARAITSVLENKQVRRSFFSVLFMPYNKSFIDLASSVKMAGYWFCSLFTFYGPRLRLGP